MRPHVDVITLAVSDLDMALAFYRDGLGWQTEGVIGAEFAGDDHHPSGRAAMFTLANGLILALYGADDLAKDAHVPARRVAGHGFSLGHTVESRAAVDAALATAAEAGGTVIGTAHERPWGIYSGYFADPDEHLWEVVYFLGSS